MAPLMWHGIFALLGSAVLVWGDGVCQTFTGGTCNVLDCSASRGPAVCTKVSFFRSECICQTGYCSLGGKCVTQTEANQPTTTTVAPTTKPTLPPPPHESGECDTAYKR